MEKNKFKYINSTIVDKLDSEDFTQNPGLVIDNAKKTDLLFSRKSHLYDFAKNFNSDKNLFFVSGFQGTGKTTFVDFIVSIFEPNVFIYKFDCSQVTNLDDIVLDLFSYISKSPIRKDIEQRSNLRQKQSIDEKLLMYLRNIKVPFVIVFDSFHNLLNEQDKVIDGEIIHFINYLLTLPTLKTVIISRTSCESEFNSDKCFNMKLAGVDENTAISFLKSSNVNAYNQVLYSVFQATRGYPLGLNLLVKALLYLEVGIFELMQSYAGVRESFELFLIKKILYNLPSEDKLPLMYLAAIRHNVQIEALTALNRNIAHENIQNLKDLYLICESQNNLFIPDFAKNIIYDAMTSHDKALLHKKINKFYEEQIPFKPSRRLLKLSRKTMHAEHYYHHIASNKNEKEYDLIGKTVSSNNDVYNSKSYINSKDISYIASSISDISLVAPTDEYKPDTTVEKVLCNTIDVKPNHPTLSQDSSSESIIDSDISLSEEEKKLIDDETEQQQDQDQYRNIEEISYEQDSIEVKEVSKSIDDFIQSAIEYESLNDLTQAISMYSKALSIAESENDKNQIANLCKKVASIHIVQENPILAINNLEKSLEIYINKNDVISANSIRLLLAKAHSDNYKHDVSLTYLHSILESGIDSVPDFLLIDTYSEIADIYEYRQNFDSALSFYSKAIDKAEKISDKTSISKLCFKMALIYDDKSDYKKALEYFYKSINSCNEPVLNIYLAESYSNIALLSYEIGKIDDSIKAFNKSIDVDRQNKNLDGLYNSLSKLGSVYVELANINLALKYYHEEIKVAKEINDSFYIASAYLELGDAYLTQREYEKAIKAYVLARKNIDHTVSTDSKEKIERRFRQVIAEVGKEKFNRIVESLKNKNNG